MPRRNRRIAGDTGNRPPRPTPRPGQEHHPSVGAKAPAFSVPWKGYSASFSSCRKPAGIRHGNKEKERNDGGEQEKDMKEEVEAEEEEEERRLPVGSTTPTPSEEDQVAQLTSKIPVVPARYRDDTQRRGAVFQEDNTSPRALNAGSLVPGKKCLPDPQQQVSVAPSDQGREQQQLQQEDGEGEEAQYIRIGYTVAGAYFERTATPPSYCLTLPPLYHLLEVAHRQQRRELKEAFAAKAAFMEHEQEGLKNQLLLVETNDLKLMNAAHHQDQQSKQIEYGEASNGVGLAPENGGNGGGNRRPSNETSGNSVVDRTLSSSTETARDTTKGDSDAKDNNEEVCNNDNSATKAIHVHDETSGGLGSRSSGKLAHIHNKTSSKTVSGIGIGSPSSPSSPSSIKTHPGSIAAATARIKAEREQIRALLKGLVESGNNLSRVRKEIVGKTKRLGKPQESRAITKDTGYPGHREILEKSVLSSLGTVEAPAKEAVEENEKMRALSNAERELAVETQSGNAPTREGRRSGGCGGVLGADGLGGGGSGGNDEGFAVGAVEILRERAAAASLAAEVARKDGDRARVELEAFKERVASVEELLSKSKATAADSASKVSEAEQTCARLRMQLQARERQIAQLQELSRGNLNRAKHRRKQCAW
ncbi:expressed unknown protein [Ectocarpus siliculosus]|uniref:Uncharacterized protein n=1 Tax=Ectocarpus siliculosus TaxID=2880 RepID=D8LCQ7_ECTSI|nr:expressed unknown protein [Ectocarpus siliculosus]|eukprot:CBN79570.1 expressed unknown protein [Ectocarpus siliculosus]